MYSVSYGRQFLFFSWIVLINKDLEDPTIRKMRELKIRGWACNSYLGKQGPLISALVDNVAEGPYLVITQAYVTFSSSIDALQ